MPRNFGAQYKPINLFYNIIGFTICFTRLLQIFIDKCYVIIIKIMLIINKYLKKKPKN